MSKQETQHTPNTCCKCGGPTIMFTADDDICEVCGHVQAGGSYNPCAKIKAINQELVKALEDCKKVFEAIGNTFDIPKQPGSILEQIESALSKAKAQ